MGALAEPIRKEFHLSDTQVGLIGSAFIWLYAIVGVPFGRLADQRSRKKLLAGGITVWSSLTALTALAGSYPVAAAFAAGLRGGRSGGGAHRHQLDRRSFPCQQKIRRPGALHDGRPGGAALSYLFSGPIAQAWGWRTAMVAAAVPAVLLIPAAAPSAMNRAAARPSDGPKRRQRAPRVPVLQHSDLLVDHRLRRHAQLQYVCAWASS